MNSKENPDDFYERFLQQLEESQNWPGLYMFKFIVKSNSNQIDKLKDLFNNPSEGVSLVNSSKNKFQSLTITIEMKSPLEVIAIYKKASEFEGVIIL
jgi:putative lipoic acid-binding regulatory protein